MRYHPFLAGYLGEDLTNAAGLFIPELAAMPERADWFLHPVIPWPYGDDAVKGGVFSFQDTIALAWRIKTLRITGSVTYVDGTVSADATCSIGSAPEGGVVSIAYPNELELFKDCGNDFGGVFQNDDAANSSFRWQVHDVFRHKEGFLPAFRIGLGRLFFPGIFATSASTPGLFTPAGNCELQFNLDNGTARTINITLYKDDGVDVSGSATITATEYWTYAKADGSNALYDAATGILLPGANPLDVSV